MPAHECATSICDARCALSSSGSDCSAPSGRRFTTLDRSHEDDLSFVVVGIPPREDLCERPKATQADVVVAEAASANAR